MISVCRVKTNVCKHRLALLLLVALAAEGGGQEPFPSVLAEAREGAVPNANVLAEESSALTLPDALSLALRQNPGLASFSWDIRAAEARKLQAGLRPNPELSLEIEGIRWRPGPGQTTQSSAFGFGVEDAEATLGIAPNTVAVPTKELPPAFEVGREMEEGAGSGFSQAEFTLRLSQLVELGAKRAKRVRLAEKEIDAVRWDYEVARADVLTDVARAFAGTLADQRRVDLTEELVRFAEEVRQTTQARVEAGQISPLELRKANVEVTTAQTDHRRALGQLDASRSRLASLWGATDPEFGRVVGRFEEVAPLPSVAELREQMAANPDVARWTAELERREAVHGLERARRIPGLTLTLGLRAEALRGSTARGYGAGLEGLSISRTKSEPDRDWDTSIVFEASMPLPFFDRNQGNIREAQYLVEKTADERRAVEVSVASALAQWRHLVAAAEAEVEALEREAIPEATETFQLAQEGFRQGKFAYLDVLDTQRTLFDLRVRLLDARLAYHEGVVEVERLIGEGLPEDK